MTATCPPPISCDADPPAARRGEAIAWLYGRINYEQTPPARRGRHSLKLERMRELLVRLGEPGLAIPTVHIAGTKGKGSTAAMIASVLQAAGLCTGLFTSPHLEQIEERFCVDGRNADQAEFVDLAETIRPVVDEMDMACRARGVFGPTFFEICTAMALLHFERQQVDAMVLEVGLGGRLDSTNVCRPNVAIITSISYDHTRQLGKTLGKIAREKAGIIKPGVPVVSGVTVDEPRQVIEEIAAERGSRLVQLGRDFSYAYHAAAFGEHAGALLDSFHYSESVEPRRTNSSWGGWCLRSADPPENRATREPQVHAAGGLPTGSTAAPLAGGTAAGLPLPLLGEHQAANAAVALAAIGELVRQGWSISPSALRQGLAQVRVPARAEVVRGRPTVILDTAHNVASIDALVSLFGTHFSAERRHLIFAATQDKDVRGMLAAILPLFDTVGLTRYASNPRGVSVAELAEVAGRCRSTLDPARRPHVFKHDSPCDAWHATQTTAAPEDLICITGSFFLAAELRRVVVGSSL